MPDRSQWLWLFFGFSGRVGRAAYLLAGFFLAVLQALPLYRFTLVPEDSQQAQGWALAFGAAMLVSLWSNVALGVKRLHDLGKPGIIAIALFIPIVTIVVFVGLCIYPGEKGPNRYGARADSPA